MSSDFDKLEDLKNEINADSENIEVKKERRGRPKKAVETDILLDFTPVFEIVVNRLPNPLPLSETEKGLINNTTNKVFSKYSQNFKYIDEINLLIVLVSVFYPRLTKTKLEDG